MTNLSTMRVTDLKCEYATNPLGIDVAQPRFSWALRVQDERRGQRQIAYQVRVASSPQMLADGLADKWDSGRVQTTKQLSIVYTGQALASGERCWWSVRTWDCDGQPTAWSEPAWFEMGLLNESDWTALWLGYPAGWTGKALYFRTFFDLAKPVKRARAYVCGLGLYEFYVNGVKATDHVLEPAQSNYARRVYYTAIDVGPLLREGRNAVGAIAGHGWYGCPKLRAQIHIDFEDGTQLVVQTRPFVGVPGWQVAAGPILSDSIYDGEVYDARLERPGWCDPAAAQREPEDRTRQWWWPFPVDGPSGRMMAQLLEPMRVVRQLEPVAVREVKLGAFVFDMGQNMVGWARLRVQGERGTTVTLKFAENANEDGTVDQGNLRGALCTDTYILKGEGVEEWEPRFTYHGFRYVQVEGYPGTPGLDAIRGCVVRSDVAQTGEFACDVDLINRIHRAVQWTEGGNLHGLPTDCPQRDERMGWLNDMTVRAEEAIHNFGLNRLYAKWIADIHDDQDADGAIPDTAPFRWGSRPADPVTMCYLLVPWLLYQHYGNTRVMAEHYDGLKAWVDYLGTRATNCIVGYSYYGDWSPPIAEAVWDANGPTPVSKHTPGPLVSTAYYHLGASLIARMAGVLGNAEDAGRYGALADRIRAAYNAAFWDEAKQVYASGNQACCALSLYMGLVPEERQARVLETLVRDVEAHNCHPTTGNLCSKYILEVLSSMGRHDLAYRLVTQTTYPSWGFMLANGATTIWERWENSKDTTMHSKNHPMMATLGAWFYRWVAGIQVEADGAGFDRCLIRPNMAEGMRHARGSLDTVHGRVESAWSRGAGAVTLRVQVPVNTSAWVFVPKPAAGSLALSEGGRMIWCDGARVGQVDGIGMVRDAGEWMSVEVASGVYEFVTQMR
jgi:alpha-L-rhamnosidase